MPFLLPGFIGGACAPLPAGIPWAAPPGNADRSSRIIIIGGTDETESVGHQDVALRLLLLVFLPFFIFLVRNLLH